MAHHSTDVNGITLINPQESALNEIIQSVFDAEDLDYPDVSIMHESGWTLVYTDTKSLLLENSDKDEVIRFMRGITPEKALRYWVLLANGDIDSLIKLKWSSQV